MRCMTELTRTLQIQLDIPLDVVKRTIQEFLEVCNAVSKMSFENGCISNNVRLHKLTYADVRARFSLSSQLSCNAIRHVASKYAVLRTQKMTPEKPVVFDRFAMPLQLDYDYSYKQGGVSLWTLDGRLKGIPLKIGGYFFKYVDWTFGGATLYIKRGKVYLSQSVHKEAPEIPHDGNMLGVDKGINYIATITDGFRVRFFGGGHVKQVRRAYTKRRAALQKKKAQHPTRSVEKVLQRLSGREKRFQRDTNHVVSKRIVQFAIENNCTQITTENLEGIRQRANELGKVFRAEINRWAFYQLQAFLEYKAENVGIAVEVIDPRNTSRACSHCGYCDKANRKRHDFTCQACGYRLHSDLNAAKNIRQRGILARQVLCQDGTQVSRPLSSNVPASAGATSRTSLRL
jgi:putative transposase